LLDGFKLGQRKVLFACFKKNLKTEIKVAQLAEYIGKHSAYHHVHSIGMAQSYCESHNPDLLFPNGQFETRRMGGKEHALARYIFTRLIKIARAIFRPDDDPLLNYLNDDKRKFKLSITILTHAMTLFDDQGPNSTSPPDFHNTDLTGSAYCLNWKKIACFLCGKTLQIPCFFRTRL
jgi:hypothetical protein